MQVTLQGCSLGVSDSVALFPHSLTDEQMNHLFILANHTMTCTADGFLARVHQAVALCSVWGISLFCLAHTKSLHFQPVSLNADAQTVPGALHAEEIFSLLLFKPEGKWPRSEESQGQVKAMHLC